MEVEFGDKDCDRLETDPNFDAGQWQSLRLRQHAGIGLPAPQCQPLDDTVGLGSGGYFVSCVLPYRKRM